MSKAETETRTEQSPAPKPRIGGSPLDMSVRFAGLEFRNPVIAAAGTFGYGIEFEDIVSLEKLGGFCVKGLSREAMVGNPPPRLFETAAGMLNAIGLQNIGARAFVEESCRSSASCRRRTSSQTSTATPSKITKRLFAFSTKAKALLPMS